MKSPRPYLIRAFYEWIVDNECTPHLLVRATDTLGLPPTAIEDGKAVLNIGPGAVRGLELGDDWVSFGARFGGVARQITVPVAQVLAIYARENGRGIVLGETDEDGPAGGDGGDDPPTRQRPTLRVVD